MRIPRYTKEFRRNYAKMYRSGKDIDKLDMVLHMLIEGVPFLPKHRDHALKGKWHYARDCHVEGDWILLYELGVNENGNETVTFHATDTHENLFG